MTFQHQNNLIGIFAKHPVAANLLMILMFLAGGWAIFQLNTQFFPNFNIDAVNVRIVWQGSTAEDVEQSITIPLEQELRTLNYLRKITSTSADGIASITLEYEDGTDMTEAIEQVKERIALIRNLPSDAESPEINRTVFYESVARLLITSKNSDLEELRPLIYDIEQDLLNRGIAKVDITGLPEQEIAIQVPIHILQSLNLSLNEIATRIAQNSQDLPAGTIGKQEIAIQLRSLDQKRTIQAIETLPIINNTNGQLLRLKDIATIEKRPRDTQVKVTYYGQPAVDLALQRTESADSLESAKILQKWLKEVKADLPEGIDIIVYSQFWDLINQRILLLIKNGGFGLVFVIVLLYLFLNARVALWVTIGIPTSFMAALALLYLFGGSINMISLFGLIMTLGIIVDDAIVVGEDALAHYEKSENELQAAEGGAQRMLAPVTASSLTTIAAFMPLMLIGGPMGKMMFELPFVVICVILASLIESFFILPGHLRGSFHKLHLSPKPESKIRKNLDQYFHDFKENIFRPLVRKAINFRGTTIAITIACLILSIGLLISGRLNFNFFPTPEGNIIYANAAFHAGTPSDQVEDFIKEMEKALLKANQELGGNVLYTHIARKSLALFPDGHSQQGDEYGSITIELVDSEKRKVRNPEFIKTWREYIKKPAGLDNLTIFEGRAGPAGRDIDIRLVGNDARLLKQAAIELASALEQFEGVNAIQDDLAYGQEQWIYSLTPQAQALGLTTESLGRQLRAAYQGQIAQIFQDGPDEIEIRVLLPDNERNTFTHLQSLPIILPNGGSITLANAITIKAQRGFEVLRHAEGLLAVQVSADVDSTLNNNNKILKQLAKETLTDLENRYNIEYSLEGKMADQKETLGDMQVGFLLALILIYIILAWVFGSYGWPLVVMAIIPFGLIGAIIGHWVMGMDLTILSLFGIFGLTGIVINDSIVLVTFYKQIKTTGITILQAIEEAACQRLRAVLLTSLTTIGGLLPLLFETSRQAQFLIPMAISISFGLMVSTFLVLVFIPALLASYETTFGGK